MTRITKKQLEDKIKQLETENTDLKKQIEDYKKQISQLEGRLQVYENIPKAIGDGCAWWYQQLVGGQQAGK